MPSARTSKPASTADDMIKIEDVVSVEVAAKPEVVSDISAPTAPNAEPGPPAGAAAEPTRRPAAGGHAFRHREIAFGDGRLVLGRDGAIRNVAADATVTATWQPGSLEWSHYAIRFGLRPSVAGGNAVPGHPPQRAKRPRT